jgi:hypothetical protein
MKSHVPITKNLFNGRELIDWNERKKLRDIRSIGILQRILKSYFTLLPRSGKKLVFRVWNLLTLSKQHVWSSVVIGTLTLGCFSKILMCSALLPICSHGCPSCNVKWQPLIVRGCIREHLPTTRKLNGSFWTLKKLASLLHFFQVLCFPYHF